tara:strand:- start:125 stop:505 length:381 start_codon:yes stop_codon:yes gene_type:complete
MNKFKNFLTLAILLSSADILSAPMKDPVHKVSNFEDFVKQYEVTLSSLKQKGANPELLIKETKRLELIKIDNRENEANNELGLKCFHGSRTTLSEKDCIHIMSSQHLKKDLNFKIKLENNRLFIIR